MGFFRAGLARRMTARARAEEGQEPLVEGRRQAGAGGGTIWARVVGTDAATPGGSMQEDEGGYVDQPRAEPAADTKE